MNTKASPGLGSRCKVLLPLILASVFIGSLSAGSVPVKVDSTNATATISVPKNAGKLLVEVKDSKTAAWRTYKNLSIKLSPATVQVALPKGFQSKSWRASTTTGTLPSAKAKYPQKFFNGKKVFQAAVASSYAAGTQVPSSPAVALKTTTASLAGASVSTPAIMADAAATTTASSSATSVAVEADIWKVDGSTAFFFNQYRGLQVIDLSDPSKPSLKAYYRMPSKGQDLYILPAQGGVQNVVLITNENDGSTGVRLLKVEGTKVTALSSQNIPGWMADSRLVGNRLYLVTQTWGWYWNSDCVTSLNEVAVDPVSGTLTAGKSTGVTGAWPVISAGGDWLAVATSDWNDWQTTKVTLFTLGESGATKSADAISLYGRLYDKDHMGYDGGRFSAVSERWVPSADSQDFWWWNGTRVTTLQNFSADGTPLASLEIQRGEALYAAKFDGNKAYVVTARQVDPLFVVDLSDATNPLLAGQLEVPGRSTRIVPVSGDKLFTIGFDGSNKVCASLFGVSDPANPTLLGRVSLGGTWGYSAATYDDKALKVLPEAGLAFVPYTSYSDSWVSQQYVQILKLDSNSGTLALGGTINNRFDPLRATVIGNTAVSISQKDLVTADLSNPDSPIVLADLLLAWPVNRILESGNYLLQISDGSSWFGGTPGLVVSANTDMDTVLGELALGEGTVKDAVVFDKTLRVLRQNGSNLSLDIYGLDALPEVTSLGSATATMPGNAWDMQVGKMLSPATNCVVSVVQPNSRCWYGWAYPPIAIDPIPLVVRPWAGASIMPAVVSSPVTAPVATTESVSVTAACATYFKNWWCGYGARSQPATALIYQVPTPSSPIALPSITLTETNAGAVNVSDAGGGLVVIGYADGETLNQWKRFRYRPLVVVNDGTGLASVSSTNQGADYGLLSTAKHHYRILDLQDPSAPVLGPVQDLPGKLLALSDLSRDGFLAWTETCGSSRQVQVSACNGSALSQVTSVNVDFGAPIAAANRSLFAASSQNSGSIISRWTLADTGALQSSGSIPLTWMPSSIQTSFSGSSLTLFGTDGVNLFSGLWNAGGPLDHTLSSWNATLWFDPSRISPISGGIAVPEGDYGAEIFRP
jgi:hypothetical protein